MDYYIDLLRNTLSANPFFQGGLLLAVGTYAFTQLRAWPIAAFKKLKYWATYEVHFDDTSEFYQVFADWFNQKYPHKFRNVEVKLTHIGDDDPGRPAMVYDTDDGEGKRRGWQLMKFQFNDSNILFYKRRWLWVRKTRDRLDGARDKYSRHLNSYVISGFFAQSAIDGLCNEILEKKLKEIQTSSLRVGSNTSGGYFTWKDVHIVKGLDHLFFAGKSELVADLELFTSRKDLYKDKGINYKRSYLFYGRGGTGKSSLATAVAKYLDYDLYVINLASINGDIQLQELSANIKRQAVVLFEDIDCVLADREVKGNDRLNFSTVLNFLDGLYSPSDCIFILTTNRPEVLDNALTRKGRIDLSMEIDYPSAADVEAFMSDFYGKPVSLQLEGKSEICMAEVQDICLKHEMSQALNKVAEGFKGKNEQMAA